MADAQIHAADTDRYGSVFGIPTAATVLKSLRVLISEVDESSDLGTGGFFPLQVLRSNGYPGELHLAKRENPCSSL